MIVIKIQALEKLKEEIAKALEGQKERVNGATPDLWSRKPIDMTILWALIEDLRIKTLTKEDVFDPSFIKIRNYSPQKDKERPYVREGFSAELRNENYIFSFHPNETGTKTILKISAKPLKDQSLNDDPIDPLLLIESSDFTVWMEELLRTVQVELEKAAEGEWHNELAQDSEYATEEAPSIRSTLATLREQLRERLMQKINDWVNQGK